MRQSNLWKRLVALTATCTLIAGVFTGCGNDTPANTSETSNAATESSEVVSTSTEVKVEEPAELTYWGSIDSNATSVITNYSELGFIQEMMEEANVNITFSHPAAGTAAEQFNLKIAGNNYEDMIEYGWGGYPGGAAQAIADGVIIDIAEYLDYAPNFKKYLEENPEIAKQIYTADGQICYFPAIGSATTAVSGGYIVRQDYLDQLNMEMPTTVKEWEDMLVAFKDKLGLEKPFTLVEANLIDSTAYFAGAWGTYPYYYLDNGTVKYGPAESVFKEYLTTMNDWYSRGLIDADSFGNDAATTRSNLLNNLSGATYGNIGATIGTVMNSAKETNPDLVLAGAMYPVLNAGEENKFIARAWDIRTSGMVAITTACEDIEAAMRYLDLYYSEEGKLWKNFGVEGVSYNLVDGYPAYTDEILKNPDGLSISEALGKYTRASTPSVGFIDPRYHEQYYQLQEQVDAMYAWNDNVDKAFDVLYPPTSLTSEESEELAAIEANLITYAKEQMTKFIMGTRSLDEYDKFIDELKSLNVEKAVEIKQAAYDRYIAN